MRPLYDLYASGGFDNRICTAASCMYWWGGGRDKEDSYYLTGSDFPTWPTRDFDIYTPTSGWTTGPRARAPQHIAPWEIDAANLSRIVAAVYGAELLQAWLDAVDYLRSLHIDFPNKYTFRFIRAALGALNYRRAQELREMANVLSLHAQVERLTPPPASPHRDDCGPRDRARRVPKTHRF